MIFTAPLALLGLAALPVLYFLLRLNPPPAQRIKFPPIELLRDLNREERTPYRMPLWILLLRLAAAALVIVGFAGPSLHPPAALPGTGPILLVIDNGWAAAADWPNRIAAADRILSAAARAGRNVSILATAPDPSGAKPRVQGVFTAAEATQFVNALQPQPWPADRLAAAAALQAAPPSTRIYLADGITDGAGFTDFMRVLKPDRIFASLAIPPLLLPGAAPLTAHLAGQTDAGLLAQDENGNVLARANFDAGGDAAVTLPLQLANKITALTLDGPPSAGGVLLLDATDHAALVGLAAGGATAETPYLGGLYFIRRALPPGTQVVTGDFSALVAAKTSMIVLADVTLSPDEQAAAQNYMANGGVLLRFAGPLTAAAPDGLSPDPLLTGDRRLGGALSWTDPLPLATFPPAAPLAGLHGDPGATVSRQILADPTTLDPATVWASLSDGTPLILGKPVGKGFLVSVLTSANTDWSRLALSGLYPAILSRLTELGRGAPPQPNLKLTLAAALSAFGTLAPAAGPASVSEAGLAGTVVSPGRPPGLYGSGAVTIALNLGGHVPVPVPANLPGAVKFGGRALPVDLGGRLIVAAFLLLIVDLLVSLRLRGLIRPARAIAMACLILLCAAPGIARAQNAALQTELGYIRTNDPGTDQTSADGLAWLSADVSAHTSAQLGPPAALDPATDDIGVYPLIYWPVLAAAPAPAPAACAALNTYMAHGGLLVIDTQGGEAEAPGSGAGFAPGTEAALRRITACLNMPPLQPLTTSDILAHCFYILPEFSGLYTGAPVYIATAPARDADNVTPLIVGQNDWAAAWARDASGEPEQTPIPGGEDQRDIAARFGTNLVIYALTGDYKGDQTASPDFLDNIGQ
jgi:hypothetical protein